RGLAQVQKRGPGWGHGSRDISGQVLRKGYPADRGCAPKNRVRSRSSRMSQTQGNHGKGRLGGKKRRVKDNPKCPDSSVQLPRPAAVHPLGNSPSIWKEK
ncbi:unnamed protein product, partial [Gulo gulo]